MRNTSIRLPNGLFEELSAQAAERGLPLTTFIRAQLIAASANPAPVIETNCK